jgi:capsular polysaccharide biosynthesis protein
MQTQPSHSQPGGRAATTFSSLARATRRRWWFGVVLVVGAAAMSLALVSRTSSYEASTTLRLRAPGSLTDIVRSDALLYLDRLEVTYARMVTSPSARDEVKTRLGLGARPDLTVKLRPNSELFDIHATASSATRAARIANTAASVLIDSLGRQDQQTVANTNASYVDRLTELRAGVTASQLEVTDLTRLLPEPSAAARLAAVRTRITAQNDLIGRAELAYQAWRSQLLDRSNLLAVIQKATPPASTHGVPLGAALALAVAGALAVLASVVLVGERFRRTVDTPEETAAAAGAPCVGVVTRSATTARPDRLGLEFRHLRASVMGLTDSATRGAMLVVDARRADAARELGFGLAAAIAEIDHSVAVIQLGDAETGLTSTGPKGQRPGLDAVLKGQVSLEGALVPTQIPGVRLLAGAADAPLAPNRFAKLLTDLLCLVDVVVVVAPPLQSSADTLAVAGEVGDVILAATLGSTRADDLRDAAIEASVVGANVRATIAVAPAPRRHSWRRRSA